MESEGKKRMVRISVWVAVLSMLLAVVASLATALEASAHAALRSMSPAAGSTVTTAPTKVVLTFNEAISTSFAAVTVTGPRGRSVVAGRPVVTGETVTQELEPVGSGRYTVTFRVVSEDGHPVSQKLTFTVALALTSTPSSTLASGAETTTTAGSSGAGATSSAPPSTTSTPVSAPASEDPQGADDGMGAPLALALGGIAVAAVAVGAVGWARRRQSGE